MSGIFPRRPILPNTPNWAKSHQVTCHLPGGSATPTMMEAMLAMAWLMAAATMGAQMYMLFTTQYNLICL
jgi:hypothetical protein